MGGAGPDDGDPGMDQPQPEQHFLGRVAVGRVGRDDHDEQRQALGVHDKVPLIAVDLYVIGSRQLREGPAQPSPSFPS